MRRIYYSLSRRDYFFTFIGLLILGSLFSCNQKYSGYVDQADEKARDYYDKHPEQTKLITIFAWNEWIEGSYLLPDMKYGFKYPEAVKRVMSTEYNKYGKKDVTADD